MTRDRGALTMAAAFTGVTAALLFASLRLQATAATVPLVVAVPTILLLIDHLVRETRRRGSAPVRQDDGLPRRERSTLAWMLLLFAMMWAIGIVLALPTYLLLHLRVRSQERWSVALAIAGVTWCILFAGLGWLQRS
jgi:hypothetical protein